MAKKIATDLRWRTPSQETRVIVESVCNDGNRVLRTCCVATAEVLGRCIVYESTKGGITVQNAMDEDSLRNIGVDASDSPYLCIWCDDFYRDRSFCVIVEADKDLRIIHDKFLVAIPRGADVKTIMDGDYLFPNSEEPIMVNAEDMDFLKFAVMEWLDRLGR